MEPYIINILVSVFSLVILAIYLDAKKHKNVLKAQREHEKARDALFALKYESGYDNPELFEPEFKQLTDQYVRTYINLVRIDKSAERNELVSLLEKTNDEELRDQIIHTLAGKY